MARQTAPARPYMPPADASLNFHGLTQGKPSQTLTCIQALVKCCLLVSLCSVCHMSHEWQSSMCMGGGSSQSAASCHLNTVCKLACTLCRVRQAEPSVQSTRPCSSTGTCASSSIHAPLGRGWWSWCSKATTWLDYALVLEIISMPSTCACRL